MTEKDYDCVPAFLFLLFAGSIWKWDDWPEDGWGSYNDFWDLNAWTDTDNIKHLVTYPVNNAGEILTERGIILI
jgi:hypothetical protein